MHGGTPVLSVPGTRYRVPGLGYRVSAISQNLTRLVKVCCYANSQQINAYLNGENTRFQPNRRRADAWDLKMSAHHQIVGPRYSDTRYRYLSTGTSVPVSGPTMDKALRGILPVDWCQNIIKYWSKKCWANRKIMPWYIAAHIWHPYKRTSSGTFEIKRH